MRGPLAPDTYQGGVAGGYRAFRGLLEALAASQGAALELRQLRGDDVPNALHPGIAGEVVWNGLAIGWIGALHPEVAQEFGLKGRPSFWKLRCRCLEGRGASAIPAAPPPRGVIWP